MKTKNLTTSLNLPPVDPLPERVQKYFNACQEKLGLIPNVLKAHSFNIDKLNAFSGLYNELMLADSNLSKLESMNLRDFYYKFIMGKYNVI